MRTSKRFSSLSHISLALVALVALAGMTLNAHSQSTHQVYLPLVKQEKSHENPPLDSGKWVSAYYVGYQRDLLPEAEIDWSSLTHIIVGRIRPDFDGGVIANFDIDDVNGPEMARTISRLAHQNGRKALLMVGGSGEYDGFVAAASDANRARFVRNLIATMDKFGYDGLDIDWEPIESKDQPQVRALLRELRAARPNMILTMPIGWINANFPEEADPFYADISQYLDQINIMSYGMSGPWGWLSWHSSALEGHGGQYPSSISASVDNYLRVGVPAAKLGVGTGFYGQCWRGVTQPRASLDNADEIANDNDMSYTNIVTRYLNQAGATRHFDQQAKVPYISSQAGVGPLGCNYISYEDAESIALKGKYVHDKGLGGTIIWTMNQGYLPDAPAGQRHPLMQAMKEHFLK